MGYWLLNDLIVALLCILFAGILIPQILLVAFRRKLFDEVDERKIHRGAVPRLGGIAFTPVIMFSVSLLLGISNMLNDNNMEVMMIRNTLPLSMSFCALLMLYLLGMADDLVGVRYSAKFVIQILCAMLIIAGGTYIDNLHGLLGVYHLPLWVGYILTAVGIVFVVNAINLIDGIDGLASGLSTAALLIYGFAFNFLDQYVYGVIAFAAVGVLIPFFYYNVFGDPDKRKKIFMGDTGSLTIGLILSILALRIFNSSTQVISDLGFNINVLIVALSPLIVPCFDVVRVFIGRMRRGNNPFLPDRTHIHHKLLAVGMPARTAMVTIVTVSLVFSIGNIILSCWLDVNLLLLLDILLWTGANMALSAAIRRRKARMAQNAVN